MIAHPHKIKRREKWSADTLRQVPEDEGATVNDGPSVSPMRYTLGRDLAILELRRPLRQYHGVAFSPKDLQFGQEIDIYAYPQRDHQSQP